MKKFQFLTLILACALFKAQAGTITRSVASLPSFGNVYPFFSSTSLRYTVSGTALTADLIITADNGFEISTTYLSSYAKTIVLTPISGAISATTIFVRFSPSSVGAASGSIVNSSVGSPSQNVGVSGTCINWAIPTSGGNYYATATGTGATLKTNLYNKISASNSIGSYASIWTSFATTDVQPNGKIWDVYSTRFDQASPYEYTLSTNQCGTYTNEGDCYNREHTFPQSWFNSNSPMVSDLFHVLASDGKVNGERSNFPFGNVTSTSYTSLYGGKRGTGTTNFGYAGTVFEPIDEYKGDFARGYFYMATRYENLIGTWTGNGNANDVLAGNSFPAYDAWHVSLLLSWHNLDPVSDKEIKRNNAIFAIQNNRNPFIDSPQFAQRIWSGNAPSEPTVSASNISIINNSNTSVTLNWKSGNGNRRIVLVRTASPVNQFPQDTIQYPANSNLSLAPQLGSGNFIVYNGTGSSVTITNMAIGTNYQYAIIEYNGWYSTSNYQSTGIATFSSTTIPVILSSFDAVKMENTIRINWITASETNNDYFTLERSYDGSKWQHITTVKGKGNSQVSSNYQYFDVEPLLQGLNHAYAYYRLKQTDFDGTETLSSIKTLALQSSLSLENILIGPNPFTNELRILINIPIEGHVEYQINNLLGETYATKEIDLQNTPQQSLELRNLDYLHSGIYILQLSHESKQYHFKIVKQ